MERAIIASMLLLQAGAQLLSCSDVKCPMDYHFAKCSIEDRIQTAIGVSQFNSSLSPNPLTWTVGFSPDGLGNVTAQKSYYLGEPRGLNLDNSTDVSGCALFFTGIGTGLRFVRPNASVSLGGISGTCGDALGNTCISDLINQAQIQVISSPVQSELRCADIARNIQSSPPVSCKTNGTWGNITAKVIAGPNSPPAVKLQGCTPTVNATYNVRSIAKFSNSGAKSFVVDVTPIMTIFMASSDNAAVLARPEIHMNCVKPMADDNQSYTPAAGSGVRVADSRSLPSLLAGMAALLALVVFIV